MGLSYLFIPRHQRGEAHGIGGRPVTGQDHGACPCHRSSIKTHVTPIPGPARRPFRCPIRPNDVSGSSCRRCPPHTIRQKAAPSVIAFTHPRWKDSLGMKLALKDKELLAGHWVPLPLVHVGLRVFHPIRQARMELRLCCSRLHGLMSTSESRAASIIPMRSTSEKPTTPTSAYKTPAFFKGCAEQVQQYMRPPGIEES